jgi:hypothetical protein
MLSGTTGEATIPHGVNIVDQITAVLRARHVHGD